MLFLSKETKILDAYALMLLMIFCSIFAVLNWLTILALTLPYRIDDLSLAEIIVMQQNYFLLRFTLLSINKRTQEYQRILCEMVSPKIQVCYCVVTRKSKLEKVHLCIIYPTVRKGYCWKGMIINQSVWQRCNTFVTQWHIIYK